MPRRVYTEADGWREAACDSKLLLVAVVLEAAVLAGGGVGLEKLCAAGLGLTTGSVEMAAVVLRLRLKGGANEVDPLPILEPDADCLFINMAFHLFSTWCSVLELAFTKASVVSGVDKLDLRVCRMWWSGFPTTRGVTVEPLGACDEVCEEAVGVGVSSVEPVEVVSGLVAGVANFTCRCLFPFSFCF